jgi:hypothetical protein
MARSSYIYILFDSGDGVLGAFTVKHEMENFVEWNNLQGEVTCRRFRDSQPTAGSSPVTLPPK